MLVTHVPFFFILSVLFELSTAQSDLSNAQNQNLKDSQVEKKINPLLRLCLDSLPDGAALLSSDTSQEILALFKLDSFWLQPVDDLLSFVQNGKLTVSLYRSNNMMSCTDKWPKFPQNPDHIVSFSAMRPEHPFYNNVLVFKQEALLRYKIVSLKYSTTSSDIRVDLLSVTLTTQWLDVPNHNELQTVTILRGSRTVTMLQPILYGFSYKAMMYVLNEANLENPVQYIANDHELPGILSADKFTLKFFYQLPANKTLYFKPSGKLCSGSICKSLIYALECDSNIQAFLDSFTFWLWKETDLTIRLIMIGLSVVGAVNFVLGLSFVRNQMKTMNELA